MRNISCYKLYLSYVLNVSKRTFSTFFFAFLWWLSFFLLPLQYRYTKNMIKKIAIMEQTNLNYSIIADYYSEHYNELKLYVMSRSLPADEAEDIVQNTFVRLLRGDKMITPVTLPCFVYTIAKNLIIDYYRRKHKIEEYEHFLGASDWMGRYDVDGESVFSAQQTNEILERGIARLTEKRSKVYRLNLFEGMQVSEIAQSLNLGYKAAENRLTLARKEIRDYMKKELAS